MKENSENLERMDISVDKAIYFLSDFHLGYPDYEASLLREKKVVAFLDSIKEKATAVFILGDMFDFWYEYKTVIPRGYTRILGKIAELSDLGIQFHFFIGNHDMWVHDYFQKELNMQVYFQPQVFQWNGKKFYIGHGDGLGPYDYGYKFLKKIFRNPLCQFLFGAIHPDLGIGLANYFSQKSRRKTGMQDSVFLGEDKEWLILYCKDILKTERFDYFIFGHRHYPMDIRLNSESHYVNLGDWIQYFSYACFDGNVLTLRYWKDS